MIIDFIKYEGAGNDYIYVDCFSRSFSDAEMAKLSIALSDRHFAVGGDGAVFICPSNRADAEMRMFNTDGSEGNMCGNAIRCVAKYLHDYRGIKAEQLKIGTKSGVKTLSIYIDGKTGRATAAKVDMGAPILTPKDIPVALSGDTVVSRRVTLSGKPYTATCVSMGNPHCVLFADDNDIADFAAVAPEIQRDKAFPEGVNVGYAAMKGENKMTLTVYERGSGFTLACGTGACAAAVAAVLTGRAEQNKDIEVVLPGGTLNIRYDGKTVFMTGPATEVFTGKMSVEI